MTNGRNITAAVVARAAQVSADMFRAYRTPHGFLARYGELNGVGFFYSRDEAIKIIVAIALGHAGLPLREAFDVIADEQHEIQHAFDGAGTDLVCRFERRGHGAFAYLAALRFAAGDAVRIAHARLDEALRSARG